MKSNNLKKLSLIIGLITISPAIVLGQTPRTMPAPVFESNDNLARTGFIPPSIDLSHLTGQNGTYKMAPSKVAAQFDWRETGMVTSIKNQSTCGACYAFASLANIESKMLIDGAGTFDLSENHAKECNYYGTSCGGGSFQLMAGLYSSEGVVLEACDPYVASDVSCNSSCPVIKTLLDWRIISGNSVPSTAALQNYIQTHGPVFTTMYAGDANDALWQSEMNAYDGSYTLYYTGSYPTNHAVLIVGWDDALTHAGGTGAWIVKNSWGTGWGGTCGYGTEDGYFTIAYGSANIGQYSSFAYDWQDYDDAGVFMNYDDGGWTNYWGYSSPTGWGMCKYVATDDIDILRVEFWTTDATTDVDVYIYDDFTGGTLSNPLASKLNSSFTEAGYHSVELDAPLVVSNGEDFYVAIKFTNASFIYPIAADAQTPVETATTYISSNGSSWYDLGTNGTPSDVAIRVRATLSLVQSVDDNPAVTPYDFNLAQNYPNPFNSETVVDFSLPYSTEVTITVYNILGQEVRTIFDEVRSAGDYSVKWDATDKNNRPVSTGVYYYRIKAGEYTQVKKLVLLK